MELLWRMSMHKKRGVFIKKTYDKSDFIVVNGILYESWILLLTKNSKGFFCKNHGFFVRIVDFIANEKT